MQVAGVRYRKADDLILGLYKVSTVRDLLLNFDPVNEGMVPVPQDHPIFANQKAWVVRDGAVVAKEGTQG